MKHTLRLLAVCISICVMATAQDGLRRRADLGMQLGSPMAGETGAVVRDVKPGSAAAAAGIANGDRILKINGQALSDEIAVDKAISALRGGDAAAFEISRGSQRMQKQVKLAEMPREVIPGVQAIYSFVTSSRGQRLRTILTRPQNARGPLPAVLLGAWLSCDSVEAPLGPSPGDGMAQLLRAIAKDSGYVLMRVDPPGRGDSEGTCADTDFLSELEGYRAGFQALQHSEFVDPNRIVILGMSNGGGYAPLIAGDAKVAGYISISGWSKTWFEHMLEIERRRMALDGVSAGEISKRMPGYEEFYTDYLIHKQTPAEVIRQKPQLKDLWYDQPAHQYGRPAAFYQQLEDLNLWAAWEKVDTPVLAIWGEHDWIMSRDDVEKIAALANQKHAGNGRFVALPRTTHGLIKNNTDEYSNRNFDTGSFNSAVVPLVFEWMKTVLAKR